MPLTEASVTARNIFLPIAQKARSHVGMKSSIFSFKSAFFIRSLMILGRDFECNTQLICLTKKKNCKYTAVFPILSWSAHVFKSLSWLIALQAPHSLHAFRIMHGPLGLCSQHVRSIDWRRSSAKLWQHVSAGETAVWTAKNHSSTFMLLTSFNDKNLRREK